MENITAENVRSRIDPGYMNATAIAEKLGILNGKGKLDPKKEGPQ